MSDEVDTSKRVPDGEVAYVECLAAQEVAYWIARNRGMGLTDKQIGDLLRAAVPYLREAWEREDPPKRAISAAIAGLARSLTLIEMYDLNPDKLATDVVEDIRGICIGVLELLGVERVDWRAP